MPFDVYMAPLGPIFHFPAIIFHNFHEIDSKVPPIQHLETQKRPNTEPQGVPEALETLIR